MGTAAHSPPVARAACCGSVPPRWAEWPSVAVCRACGCTGRCGWFSGPLASRAHLSQWLSTCWWGWGLVPSSLAEWPVGSRAAASPPVMRLGSREASVGPGWGAQDCYQLLVTIANGWLSANRLGRGLQSGACQPQCPRGRMNCHNWLLLVSVSLGGVPASLGGSSRWASGSDSGSCQIIASALGLRACKILCMHLRAKFLFPTVLCLSQMQTPLAFKASHSEGSSSQYRTPDLGSLM